METNSYKSYKITIREEFFVQFGRFLRISGMLSFIVINVVYVNKRGVLTGPINRKYYVFCCPREKITTYKTKDAFVIPRGFLGLFLSLKRCTLGDVTIEKYFQSSIYFSIFYGVWIKQSGAMVYIFNLDKVLLKKLFPTINI